MQNQDIKQKGKFLYGDSVECEILIVGRNFKPGTGDDEDELEVQHDQPGIWYELKLGTPTKKDPTYVGAGYFQSITEAMAYAEKLVKVIHWEIKYN